MKSTLRRKAFTLIEISVVLVIIGIILASVMKGRDLIKSSQIKEFNQVFVSQWETIANSYFSRMAAPLNDGASHGGTGTSDGFMDGTALATAGNALAVAEALQDAGVDPCDLIKGDIYAISTANFGCGDGELDPFKITVDGEYSGKQTIQIEFTHYTIGGKKKNVIRFYDVPFDVGQAIDTMRDGNADGTKGSILALSEGNTASAGNTIATSSLMPWAESTTGAINRDNRDMLLILEH
jgi:prepilin-type N-terminal cleavage/methylation domain-containing protein